MVKHLVTSLIAAAALAATPSPAAAAETVVVPGAVAQRMTALDGTIVWTSAGRLMQRSPAGTVSPVQGAPLSDYRSLDLGRDRTGALVLTYLRCSTGGSCAAYSDDLAGHRVVFKRVAPRGCALSAAPSQWGSRVAYGLNCSKRRGPATVFDKHRSGLYVRTARGIAKRLRMAAPEPGEAFFVTWVDLRGTSAGAVAAARSETYAFSMSTDGTRGHAAAVADNRGFLHSQVVRGLAIRAGGELWTLINDFSLGQPSEAQQAPRPWSSDLSRLNVSGCEDTESFFGYGAAGATTFHAEAMAADAGALYLYVPGTGIVTHEFVSELLEPCA